MSFGGASRRLLFPTDCFAEHRSPCNEKNIAPNQAQSSFIVFSDSIIGFDYTVPYFAQIVNTIAAASATFRNIV